MCSPGTCRTHCANEQAPLRSQSGATWVNDGNRGSTTRKRVLHVPTAVASAANVEEIDERSRSSVSCCRTVGYHGEFRPCCLRVHHEVLSMHSKAINSRVHRVTERARLAAKEKDTVHGHVRETTDRVVPNTCTAPARDRSRQQCQQLQGSGRPSATTQNCFLHSKSTRCHGKHETGAAPQEHKEHRRRRPGHHTRTTHGGTHRTGGGRETRRPRTHAFVHMPPPREPVVHGRAYTAVACVRESEVRAQSGAWSALSVCACCGACGRSPSFQAWQNCMSLSFGRGATEPHACPRSLGGAQVRNRSSWKWDLFSVWASLSGSTKHDSLKSSKIT